MRRKAHGERFSLGEEWRNSRAEGQNHARKGKVCSGKCKTRAAGKARSEKTRGRAGKGKPARRKPKLARRKTKLGRRMAKLARGRAKSRSERQSLLGKYEARAAGKAPPFEFLPLLSTCPLGGHATPWFTAPWISAPLASLFLDFFHPLNSCHLLVLHSFTPAYWVSDYPFFDSRHCRF